MIPFPSNISGFNKQYTCYVMYVSDHKSNILANINYRLIEAILLNLFYVCVL